MKKPDSRFPIAAERGLRCRRGRSWTLTVTGAEVQVDRVGGGSAPDRGYWLRLEVNGHVTLLTLKRRELLELIELESRR